MARIKIATGIEGPRHDPYGYEESTVYLTAGGSVILRAGALSGVTCSTYDLRGNLVRRRETPTGAG